MAKKKATPSVDRPKTKAQKKPEHASSAERSAPKEAPQPEPPKIKGFPIVGIGASAGGLEAFEQFFTHMPAESDSGMALALVQHLDPSHKSILVELVRRYTRMQVYEVEDGMAIEPNCTYIIPPNRDMALLHGRLHLIEPEAPRGLRLPIDFFFRSLAQDQREQAICIVLSGTGSDGALGLKAIKGEGGMAMAQDPASARYDGMPRSAIGTGLVDYILPPDKMPAQLLAYVEHAFGKKVAKASPTPPKTAGWLQKIFILLRDQTGHDFSYYKQNTIRRRIERRMTINQIERLDHYVRYLQQNPLEVETLFRELLIGVTNFFRDPEAFDSLKKEILPRLFENLTLEQTVRIWVPGCSTGEEAYSIAMLFQEYTAEQNLALKVQVFATDIDSEAIDKARAGLYPNGIAADVSPERLGRFFTQDQAGGTYQIKKSIRDMVVFAEQNVIDDPPFSKLDLISCRNLLIYLGPELQKKVIPLFHYALNENCFLFLGNSESIGDFIDLFAPLDRKWKLFQRKGAASARRALPDFAIPSLLDELTAGRAVRGAQQEEKTTLRELAEKALLAEHTPACVIINEKCEILYIHGRTGKYLEPSPGEVSVNILGMAREGLRLELATAIRNVIAHKKAVHYQDLPVKTNGDTQTINLLVKPILKPAAMQSLLLVIFEDVTPDKLLEEVETTGAAGEDKEQHVGKLERELRAKEEYLQTTIEEMETANEELKSTNEELQSTNEELQSTNEELETSKEELQSVNEELVTVNMELQKKIEELSRASNDMNNLLAGTEIATVFVDHQLHIQRFTPAITRLINLIQTDIGRPIGHIVSNLAYDNLGQDIQAVLDKLVPKEAEVCTTDGRWYLMRILPYRTLENVIEGAVLTFMEITEQKRMQEELHRLSQAAQEAREYAENILDTVREPLLVLDAELKVVSASRSFYGIFRTKPAETEGRLVYDLGNKEWHIPELERLLADILPQESTLSDFEVRHNFETIGPRTMLLNAREIKRGADRERLILLAIEDVTEHREAGK